ncbi:GNAT family N-acetyltransferase [Hymenobacter terricola]|uniref:GNAT family N-acetyltransferase n=1 Tax=Hymenobacter terricola TaxID=2819236 RepID=UPI001B3130AD|nr:GNAT family N-acetyltransferase [Hymenobacter terricola]
MIEVFPFAAKDQKPVRDFVLAIQNTEFNLGFTEAEQPDLLDTAHFYQQGGFWLAKEADKLVGTIGLQKLDAENGVLRKMFVLRESRGAKPSVAQFLFDTLVEHARRLGFKTIYLDTPAIAVASHKFYERNGFALIDRLALPASYTFPDRDSKVYRRSLLA